IRKAIVDAGISPDEIDGLVLTPESTTGASNNPNTPPPPGWEQHFKMASFPQAGITRGDIDWLLLNMPELKNVKFMMNGNICMSVSFVAAAEAVARGLTKTCLVARGWHNLAGRYYVGVGASALNAISGRGKYSSIWGMPACGTTAVVFEEYCRKYGKSHDQMANFVVTQRRNGLMNPDGYYSQHRPEMITVEDYLTARWIAKPANIYDNDLPIMAALAVVFTTPERAKNQGRLALHEIRDSADVETGRRLDRQYGIGRRISRLPQPVGLQCFQAWRDRPDQDRGTRICAEEYSGQLRQSGRHRHPDGSAVGRQRWHERERPYARGTSGPNGPAARDR